MSHGNKPMMEATAGAQSPVAQVSRPWQFRATEEWSPAMAATANIAASSGTRQVRDLATQALLIRAARTEQDRAFAVAEILAARAAWLVTITKWQREWQSRHTRRASRARHHDSVSLREKYVRC